MSKQHNGTPDVPWIVTISQVPDEPLPGATPGSDMAMKVAETGHGLEINCMVADTLVGTVKVDYYNGKLQLLCWVAEETEGDEPITVTLWKGATDGK